jgi:hypothetical protein
MISFFKKKSKQDDVFSKFKRKERNKRYYLRHRDEIRQKRKDYYLTNGK